MEFLGGTEEAPGTQAPEEGKQAPEKEKEEEPDSCKQVKRTKLTIILDRVEDRNCTKLGGKTPKEEEKSVPLRTRKKRK